MTKSDTNEIKDRIKKLTPDQRKKLMGEAPSAEAVCKLLTDEQLQAELIGKAYRYHPVADALSFDDWVQMKIPSLDWKRSHGNTTISRSFIVRRDHRPSRTCGFECVPPCDGQFKPADGRDGAPGLQERQPEQPLAWGNP